MSTEETKTQDQFIGQYKVLCTIELENSNTDTGPLVQVKYEGVNHAETMPLLVFNNVVRSEPVDWTTLRELRVKPLLLLLADTCLKFGLKFSEIGYVSKALADKLQDSFERASSLLWTNDDREWIPGVNFMAERNLSEADVILKNIKKYEDPNETEAAGDGADADNKTGATAGTTNTE